MTFNEAIQKLDDMISKRFDVSLRFVSADSSENSDIVSFETVRRNAGAPLIVTHNNMLIPLRVEGSLAGAIRVSDIAHLNHVDLSRIKETIDLVMENKFLSKTLSFLPSLDEVESKVLPFRRPMEKLATAN